MYYNTDQLSSKELIDYLGQLVKLETSIYMQQQAKEAALHSLADEKQRGKPFPPIKEYVRYTHMDPPSETIEISDTTKFTFKVAVFLCVFSLFSIWAGIKSSNKILLIIGIFLFIIGVLLFLLYKKESNSKYDEHEKQLQRYRESAQAAKISYEQEKIAAEKKYQRELKEYKTASAEFKQKCHETENKIKALDQPLDESCQLLEQLYQKDWLFPKYRNMVAVCSIYEYLVTGRCSQLTGADGAYNLYESELRQNLILVKLDAIIKDLQQIKQNQYMLYAELQKINKHLAGISSDIRRLLRTTQSIADNTAVTARNSHLTAVHTEAIASNTEALKYLTMING